jgi:esterase/lipase
MEPFNQGIEITNGSSTCVLVLHGYSETPYEYKHVAEAIAALKDVDVLVPLLPHHGINSAELAKADRATTWTWLMARVEDLTRRYQKIILLGQSMGTGAAITAVVRGAKVDGLIVASANGIPSKKIRFAMGIARALHVHSFKAYHITLRRRPELDPGYLAWMKANFPRISLHVFLEALDELPAYIKDTSLIRVPVMIIHGTKDFATNVQKTSDFYFKIVSSRKKITIIVENTGHAVFSSPHFDALMVQVRAFIQDIVEKGDDGVIAKKLRIGRAGVT